MVAHGLRILNYCLPDGREGGGRGRGRGGGTSKQHIYICISTLDLVIRQRKNQLPPKTLWGRCIYYLFSGGANIRERFAHFSGAHLNLPGQLVDCGGVLCTACSYLSRYNHETVRSAGPGSVHASELISPGCWCALKYCTKVISVSGPLKDVHA